MPVQRVDGGTAPDLLTVEEAAAVLRIGRTSAYELARRGLATDGADGLPVQRIGGLLRVSRYRLEAMIGGPITWPPPSQARPAVDQPGPAVTVVPMPTSRAPRKRRSTPADAQSHLPFGA